MKTELIVDRLSVDRIRRHVVTDAVGRHIYLFDEIPSTNDALRELARAGAEEGTIVLAEGQSAGRGRMGAAWFSPSGLNLYVSVLFRPLIALASVPVFSFIASLAMTDAIWSIGLSATIKWPNDVLVDGRKVGGCLVDIATTAGHVDHVILGTGINLNVPSAELRATLGDAASAAGSMAELAGHLVDRNVFTATLINYLERWLNVYTMDGPTAILTAWRSRDALAGQDVVVCGEGTTYRGRADGVDGTGYLIVQDAAGVRHRVRTGEIRLAGATGEA
jgi:BirA family biotin operon repressor/biotin-[acetyl-CoA-carboxylase] ligase